MPLSRVILHFFLFFFLRWPFIFLRPVSFKVTEVKQRTKELENKSRRYLQPRLDSDTFQLYIPPLALFPDPLQLRKRLRRFMAVNIHRDPLILCSSALFFFKYVSPFVSLDDGGELVLISWDEQKHRETDWCETEECR